MPPLAQAYLQRAYRSIGYVFMIVVFAVFGFILYTSWAKTVIAITPLLKPTTASFDIRVGPASANVPDQLIGTVTVTNVSATVQAEPDATGQPVPAHATGSVTFHNDSPHPQPLAAGTRLRSDAGVIVRTTKMVQLSPHTTLAADVIADPLGQDGEVPPGKFVIVALWPGLQASIYAISDAALTGGTTSRAGTLSIDRLTSASNDAKDQLQKDFGQSADGTFRALVPASVVTVPDADTPSTTYAVTVTMKEFAVTYPSAEVLAKAKTALEKNLADTERLATIAPPGLAIGEQPSNDSITLRVTAAGRLTMRSAHPLLDPKTYVGLDRSAITTKLLGSGYVKDATVRFAPWWRVAAGNDPGKIQIVLEPAVKS